MKSRRKGRKQRDVVGVCLRCHQRAGSDSPSSPPSAFLIFVLQECGYTLHDELDTWDGHAVPQGFVTGRIRGGWDVCPPVRETLQPLALKGRQAANQVDIADDALIVADILVTDPLMIGSNQ